MALNITELFQSESHPIPDGAHCTERATKEFSGGTGVLPKLCPVAYDTSVNKWVPLTHGGATGTDVIKGFLWPVEHTLVSGAETLAVVMLAGEINFGDLNTADILAATGKSEAQLKTALRTGLRELNLTVTGLDQVR